MCAATGPGRSQMGPQIQHLEVVRGACWTLGVWEGGSPRASVTWGVGRKESEAC